MLHVGLPARPRVPASTRVGTGRQARSLADRIVEHRRSLRRRRPPRPRPAVPGRGGHRARSDRRRHAAVRRCDGLGDHRRGVTDPGGDRLLRGHRGVRRRLRSASCRGVDRGPDGLVRSATRPRSLPWSVPRAPVRGAPGARVVAGCGTGRGGRAPLPERTWASLHRRGALPARRAASTPWGARRRRARTTERRAATDASRRPASSCFASPKDRFAAAVTSIQRVVEETRGLRTHPAMLATAVEVLLAAGDADAARDACRRAREARHRGSGRAVRPGHGRVLLGSVLLAEGDAMGALVELRRAGASWRDLEMPYDAARASVQIARACRALSDHDAADRQLETALATFERLGARTDLARAGRLARSVRRCRGRAHRPAVRRPEGGGNRQVEPRGGRGPRHQRAHRRAAPAEHLHEARPAVAGGGHDATPTSTGSSDRRTRGGAVVRTDHAIRAGSWPVRSMWPRAAVRTVRTMTNQLHGHAPRRHLLAELIADDRIAGRPRSKRQRRVPRDLLDDLNAAGLLRLLVPTSHGGAGADIVTAMRLYEDLAAADASVAWIVMIGGGAWVDLVNLAARHLRRGLREGPRRHRGRRVQPGRVDHPVTAGYRVEGRWGFASGCEHADWIYGNCVEGLVDGHPMLRAALFTRDDIVIEDTWTATGHVRHRQPPLPGRRPQPSARSDLRAARGRALHRRAHRPRPHPRVRLPAGVQRGPRHRPRRARATCFALAAGKVPHARARRRWRRTRCSSTTWRSRTRSCGRREACCTRPPRRSGRRAVDGRRLSLEEIAAARGLGRLGNRARRPTSSTPRTGSAAGRPCTPTRRSSAACATSTPSRSTSSCDRTP